MSRARFLTLLLLCACSGTPDPATTPSATAQEELAIDVRPQSVRLAIGQTLIASSAGMKWMATFDTNVLALVAPQGPNENTAANEWRFRGRAAGETDVTFTGQVSAECATPPNCPPPPAPPTVVVHVQVTQQENHD